MNFFNSSCIACINGVVDSALRSATVDAFGASTRVTSTVGTAGRWKGPALIGRTNGDGAPLPQARLFDGDGG